MSLLFDQWKKSGSRVDFPSKFAQLLHHPRPFCKPDGIESETPHLHGDARLGIGPVNLAAQWGNENLVALLVPLLRNSVLFGHDDLLFLDKRVDERTPGGRRV